MRLKIFLAASMCFMLSPLSAELRIKDVAVAAGAPVTLIVSARFSLWCHEKSEEFIALAAKTSSPKEKRKLLAQAAWLQALDSSSFLITVTAAVACFCEALIVGPHLSDIFINKGVVPVGNLIGWYLKSLEDSVARIAH